MIKTRLSGREIDRNLKTIVDLLEDAQDRQGEVLYVRKGKLDSTKSIRFFRIIELKPKT